MAESQVKIDPGTGEILARGPQVMVGYHNQPEETAQVIDADGWFHTGDIGELDAIGRVIITDRLKNIIVLANGKNVAPAPMEIALAHQPYIAQAVIIGDRQPYTGVLIAPDFDELGSWAAANGLAEVPPEQLVDAMTAVEKLFHDGDASNAGRASRSTSGPRRIALLPRLLTEEDGEMTPSLKIKLRVVKENWADQVAYLFDEDRESRDWPIWAGGRIAVPCRMSDVFILSAARTPIGKFGGGLSDRAGHRPGRHRHPRRGRARRGRRRSGSTR